MGCGIQPHGDHPDPLHQLENYTQSSQDPDDHREQVREGTQLRGVNLGDNQTGALDPTGSSLGEETSREPPRSQQTTTGKPSTRLNLDTASATIRLDLVLPEENGIHSDGLLTKGPHTKGLLTDSHTTHCLPTAAGYYIPSHIDFIWSHKVSYSLKWSPSLSSCSPPIFAKLSPS